MTQITVPTTKRIDIRLDATLRLPMAGRIRRGMKSTCANCRKPITDEFFVAGFAAGRPNMTFHEQCVDLVPPKGEIV